MPTLPTQTTSSSAGMAEAVQAQYARIRPLLPQYLEKMGISDYRYETNLKNLMSNVRSRPALVLQQCAEYLHIDEAQMRERFAGAIEAIGQYKQTNQSTKEAEP